MIARSGGFTRCTPCLTRVTLHRMRTCRFCSMQKRTAKVRTLVRNPFLGNWLERKRARTLRRRRGRVCTPSPFVLLPRRSSTPVRHQYSLQRVALISVRELSNFVLTTVLDSDDVTYIDYYKVRTLTGKNLERRRTRTELRCST